MVTIPAGTATLTDRRTRRTWRTEVASFALAACPVTVAEYAEVTGLPGSGDHPVAEVSWWDAVEYCQRLSKRAGLRPAYRIDGETVELDPGAEGFRLPGEAEWEFACRAGTSGPRYGELDEIAWYRDNSGERVHPVGQRLPNAWGLYDMIGNVWEWCFEYYDPTVYGDYRVIKGGGWLDEHWSCRVGVRRRTMPTLRIDDLGFRVARSVGHAGDHGV